jgi:GAF domain-containing protein/HAMP domain-containing protein
MTTPKEPRQRRRESISLRLTMLLMPLVIIPLLLLGAGTYLRAQQLLRGQATAQLSSAAVAEYKILQDWTRARESRVSLAAQSVPLRQAVGDLLAEPASLVGRTQLTSQLDSMLTQGNETLFSGAMVVRASDNVVLLATDMGLEGRVAAIFQDATVPTDRLATTPVYDDPLVAPGDFSILSSSPIRAAGGDVDSYLVGYNRDIRLGTLMNDMQVLWEERGAYRVELGQTFIAVAPDIAVTYPRYATRPQVTTHLSHPVFDLAKSQPDGFAEYASLGGTPVVGAYQWSSDQGMGIVLEVPQSEVYSGLNSLAPYYALLLAGAVLAVALLVPLVTRQALQPLRSLAQGVERIARGQFEQRVAVGRRDEVGQLAESFNTMAEDLQTMYGSLEARVTERTYQIRTASEVARDAALIRDIDTLLQAVVRLISDRFAFYHAGIFLIDGPDAVLVAASSEGGQRMLQRGHRLAVGKVGIVGYVTGTGTPRIALDVGGDAVHFANPDLPHTRSELALPLRVGDSIVGALDVQSTEPNAFDDNDVVVLQTMADQLATALENARLLDTLSRQSTDRQRVIDLYARLVQQADYERMLQDATGDLCQALAFHHAELALIEGGEAVVRSASDTERSAEASVGRIIPSGQGTLGRAIASREVVVDTVSGATGPEVTIGIPLASRGQPIGALAVTRRGATSATTEDLELLQLLAAPLAAALENARLVEESQRSLQELDSLYRQQASDAWQQLLRSRGPSREGLYQPGAEPAGMEGGLAIPIEIRGEVIGAMDIQARPGAELDREDELILEAVGDELASALEQARLMEEIRRRAVQLQAAAEISRETTSQLDSTTLLSRAAHLLHDRFGYDQVAIYRLDWSTSNAVVEAAAGRGAEALLADRHEAAVGSATVLGYVTQSGNAYAARDGDDDPYFAPTPYLPDVKAELGLPLMVGDQVFGAITIRHTQSDVFSRDDIIVLEVLADQIAVGVQNARLFEATLKRAQREQTIIDITGKIRMSQGIDGILRTAVREMRTALQAKQAQIWLNPGGEEDGNGRGNGGGQT